MGSRILVAEDDADIRRLLSVALAKWGYEVQSASDGRQACELFEGEMPDMAILDWMLPGVGGVDLCRRLRSSPAGQAPFVLMLTAKTSKADVVEALDAGADDYVTKPFDLEEIKARLAAASRRRSGHLPVAAPVTLTSGAMIAGRYRLKEKLGEGGMGVVWAARHVELNRDVAIKVLHPRVAAHPEAMARFELEARAACRLRSAHVAAVLDYGVLPHDVPYLVMERLDGESLREAVSMRGPLPPEEVARILEGVAIAIDEAHGLGIVHRDLKPENVFLHRDGARPPVAKLLDFGIARLLESADEELRNDRGGLVTRDDALMGTHAYMSPEQFHGDRASPASDGWALGATVFFALTGQSPFEGRALGDVAMRVCVAPLPLPSARRPELPKSVDEWFLKCCNRRPLLRFPSARAAATALTEAVASTLGSQNPASVANLSR